MSQRRFFQKSAFTMLSDTFFEELYQKHSITEPLPPTAVIAQWANKLLYLLFPEQTREHYRSVEEVKFAFETLDLELRSILSSVQQHLENPAENIVEAFTHQVPEIYRLLRTDVHAILMGDPAAKTEYEVIRAYPGFYAIAFYRIAHALHGLNIPFIPRILTEYAHSKTGIDIHPAAQIGEYFFIDHGTGVVIGETTVIGQHVKIYQGVTLGALSVSKTLASKKRHPSVEDHVVIYSGATILGGDTTIGHHSIVGGNVWLTRSIPSYSTVYHKPEIKVIERELMD